MSKKSRAQVTERLRKLTAQDRWQEVANLLVQGLKVPTRVYRCPECGCPRLTSEGGLWTCEKCGCWFDPTHPASVEAVLPPYPA